MSRPYLTVGLALLLALGAGRGLLAQGSSLIIQRVLVKVNGEAYTQKDLEEKQIEALQQAGKGNLQGEALNQALTEMMPDLLVSAVDEILLLQRGKEAGYHLSDDQFKDTVERIKQENKLTDETFKEALAQEGLTLEGLRKRLDRSFIVQQVQQHEVLAHMSLTEQEMRQYYEQHPQEFATPATVTLRELLVAVPVPESKPGQQPVVPPSVDEAARQKALALRQRALSGEDFQKLVAEASDAPSKSNGGLIGPINESELASGVRDALDALQPAGITEPIRATRGYTLFELVERTPSAPQPFEKVHDDIAQKVGEARLDVETAKYLQTLRAQAYLEWKRPDLRQMYEKGLAERASNNLKNSTTKAQSQ